VLKDASRMTAIMEESASASASIENMNNARLMHETATYNEGNTKGLNIDKKSLYK
jgi:hypothetical protein